MFCYQCGCHLSEYDFCPSCGVDVTLYKKIISVSNFYYNQGLEKAKVRDLSGAIISLRQSLKFNKNNIAARNLLGLVYFEMGEVVSALSEWVISKNQSSQKNLAGNYINMVQTSGSRLETVNSTIKKYNQAYNYCIQNTKDLAILQLKKVVSLNPRFIRARLLLALLYIDAEQWQQAKKQLSRCIEIDHNNTLALLYLKEVDAVLTNEEVTAKSPVKHKKEESIRYQSDNEIIIQPLTVKEPTRSGASTLLNIGIGLIIGLAAMYFLVVPAAVSNAKNEAQTKVAEIGNQIDTKSFEIAELQAQIEELKQQNNNLNQEVEGYAKNEEIMQTMTSFIDVVSVYLETGDKEQIAVSLESIAAENTLEGAPEAFLKLYQTILKTIGPELSVKYYNTGSNDYYYHRYAEAIVSLEKAVYYDAENKDALYSLANAYRQNGETEKAIATYDKVIELFPGSNRANQSQEFKNSLTQGGQ